MPAVWAVAIAVVLTAVALELLAGLPLFSAFVTWFDRLARGQGASPAAVWRDLRAEEELWRWPLGKRPRPGLARDARAAALDQGESTTGTSDGALPQQSPPPRLYADAQRDTAHGEEDPPLYRIRAQLDAVIARITGYPLADAGTRARAQEKLNRLAQHPAYRREMERRLARPRLIKRRRDGIVLGHEASDALLRDVLGDKQPDA